MQRLNEHVGLAGLDENIGWPANAESGMTGKRNVAENGDIGQTGEPLKRLPNQAHCFNYRDRR